MAKCHHLLKSFKLKTKFKMKNLFKSLAAFQQECPTIHKGTQGYGYSYADLAAINSVINPLLAKHGYGIYVKNLDAVTTLVTTILSFTLKAESLEVAGQI
jgi:hypothetical protein